MRMKILGLPFMAGLFLVFLGTNIPASETVPTKQEIIDKLSISAKDLKSFSARLVQRKYFFLFNEEEVYSGKIYYEAPGNMVINIEKPKAQILGSDGKTGWLYLPDIKQVQKMSLETLKNRGASFMKFLIDPAPYFQEHRMSIQQVIADGKDRILKVQVSSDVKQAGKKDFEKLVLWIRESRPLPLMKLELTESNKDMVLYELSHVVYNPKLQPELLNPHFPKDVEIVEY